MRELNTFSWPIFDADKVDSPEEIQESIFQFVNIIEDGEAPDSIHRAVADIFYLSQLKKNYGNPNIIKKLNKIDSAVNSLFFVAETVLSEIDLEIEAEDKYRVAIKKLEKELKPLLYNPHNAPVNWHEEYIEFPNKSKRVLNSYIRLVCETYKLLVQSFFSDNLIDFENIAKRYPKWNERFINKNKCFSIMDVTSGGKIDTYVTLSGIKCHDNIVGTISEMLQKCRGDLSKAFIIAYEKEDLKDVRYYMRNGSIITYEEALKFGPIRYPRMFSCCERKNYAKMDQIYKDKRVTSFKMYVRFSPCCLCTSPTEEYTLKYNGEVRSGSNLCSIYRECFDRCADAILRDNP